MTTILKHYPIRSKIFHLNVFAFIYILFIFLGHASGKELTCQCRRHKRCGFDPWVGKIPWRRKWQPTPVFFPGKLTPWTEEPGGLQSMGSQRVRHDWSDFVRMFYQHNLLISLTIEWDSQGNRIFFIFTLISKA